MTEVKHGALKPSENLPTPINESWVPDWIQDLKSVPGALSAVGKLIGGATKAATTMIDIGTAQNEQQAQAIRDITKARTALTDAAVKTTVKQMGKDPQIAERLLDRLISDGYQAQENRESIGLKALEYVRQDPPKEEPRGEPSDEWLKRFGLFAEQATSELIIEHWAHILSSEIKSPGNFSFVALHLASLLDKSLAETVERVTRNVVFCKDTRYGFVPFLHQYNDFGDRYEDLMMLDGIGFLTMSSSSEQLTYDENGHYVVRVGKDDVRLEWAPNTKVSVGAAQITRAGFELINVINSEADPEFITHLIAAFSTPFYPGIEMDPPAFQSAAPEVPKIATDDSSTK